MRQITALRTAVIGAAFLGTLLWNAASWGQFAPISTGAGGMIGDGTALFLPESMTPETLPASLALIAKPRITGEGRLFSYFMGSYLLWRFMVEFIKPRELRIPAMNLSAIQLASLAGAAVCAASLVRGRTLLPEPEVAA